MGAAGRKKVDLVVLGVRRDECVLPPPVFPIICAFWFSHKTSTYVMRVRCCHFFPVLFLSSALHLRTRDRAFDVTY